MLCEFTCKNCNVKLSGGLEDFPLKIDQELEEKNKIRRTENEKLQKEYDAAMEIYKKEIEFYKENLKKFKNEYQTNSINLYIVVETENGAERRPAKLTHVENSKPTHKLEKPRKPNYPSLVELLESHYILCPVCKRKNFRGEKYYETFYEE